MIFYHVDRSMRLLGEETINPTPYVNDTLYGSIFHNLSVHGNLYFRDWNTPDVQRDIEITLEYIRSVKFPHLPSRFQSIFASKTLKECEFWINKFGIKEYNLVILESENYTELDCSWITPQPEMEVNLQTRCAPYSLGAMCDIANMYWSGEKTNTPIIEVLIPLPCKVIKTKRVTI